MTPRPESGCRCKPAIFQMTTQGMDDIVLSRNVANIIDYRLVVYQNDGNVYFLDIIL